MIKEISNQYNANELEKNIHALWDEIKAYEKARNKKDGPNFLFVDGPPYTTGNIHLGTAWNKILKDCVLRHRSMNGFHVIERAGWDMHGLPIEVKVEELLGFKSKKDIEEYGVGNFIEKCKEFALDKKDSMTEQFKMLGVWLNWKEPYMTLKNEYIEAAWWAIKKADEKNLVEIGKRVVNWCPRCETAIADSEVEYKDRRDPSIYIKFELKDFKNTYLVIWTTTPWTIPANMAVAINPKFEYSKVKVIKKDGGLCEYLIIASDLVEAVVKKGGYESYEIIEIIKGADLKGTYTHPLVDLVPKQSEFEHNIYPANFVTSENTGCVHIATGHGMDDFEIGIKNNIPIFCPVESNGSYTAMAGKYAGMDIRDANNEIMSDLESNGLLLFKSSISHRYGHCWRCKTPIIYLATEQLFVKIPEIKEDMLCEIEKVKWHPDWAGSARFKSWVEDARDWCVSRQRYWGIPIPIWRCDSCNIQHVIGTKKELIEKTGADPSIELHRPYIDELTIKCECGKDMSRTEDVFDVWFDSAVASWATLDFPHTDKDFNKYWPADFITEGHDQTRGWFYSQMGASMISHGTAPYKTVLMHGFTLDKDGKKMSKSIGNVITPIEVIDKYGADALRAYILSASAPWEDVKFIWDEVATIHRTLNIFWNVYRFPIPYMVLDKFNPMEISFESVQPNLRKEDKYILSCLNSLIESVDLAIDKYLIHKAIRSINEFIVEKVSRWYIPLVRPRTWTESDNPDKLAAYRVLYEVMVTTSKLMAPFMPHIAEEIYQNLVVNVDNNALESVHLCDWPIKNDALIDKKLESFIEITRSIVEVNANLRQKVGRKLRWPVSKIVIIPNKDNRNVYEAVEGMRTVLMSQTNSKDILLVDAWDEIGKEIVPNMELLGPAFKKDAKVVANALKSNDCELVFNSIKDNGNFMLNIDERIVEITKEMVSFSETIPELVVKGEFEGGQIFVDARLTPEIEAEGYSREVIRRIQDMRKEFGLAVEDTIEAYVEIKDERVVEFVSSLKEYIAKEVRADSLEFESDVEVKGKFLKEWSVEGIVINIGISKIV